MNLISIICDNFNILTFIIQGFPLHLLMKYISRTIKYKKEAVATTASA